VSGHEAAWPILKVIEVAFYCTVAVLAVRVNILDARVKALESTRHHGKTEMQP
jgi:hypothetical protein